MAEFAQGDCLREKQAAALFLQTILFGRTRGAPVHARA